MTLINGAPGAARPGENGGPAGRGTPQSGIPTQGAPPADLGSSPARPSRPFSAPFSAPPGSVPPPRPTTPPAGAPAQRSPLVVGPAPRPGPDDDRTSLVSRSEPSVTDTWKKALEILRRRGPMRWSLLGVLALLQAFVLFSAVMWWMGSSTASATANVAPQTWTGIVYDVGAAGVNLRSDPQVRPDDARDTAARGARLALRCGQTGDVVAKGSTTTATWVQTTDGLWVSMLYVRVPDQPVDPELQRVEGRRTSARPRRPGQSAAPSAARNEIWRRSRRVGQGVAGPCGDRQLAPADGTSRRRPGPHRGAAGPVSAALPRRSAGAPGRAARPPRPRLRRDRQPTDRTRTRAHSATDPATGHNCDRRPQRRPRVQPGHHARRLKYCVRTGSSGPGFPGGVHDPGRGSRRAPAGADERTRDSEPALTGAWHDPAPSSSSAGTRRATSRSSGRRSRAATSSCGSARSGGRSSTRAATAPSSATGASPANPSAAPSGSASGATPPHPSSNSSPAPRRCCARPPHRRWSRSSGASRRRPSDRDVRESCPRSTTCGPPRSA